MYSIRFAGPADLPRIVGIYNQAILTQKVTGDVAPFSVEQRRQWFDQHDPDRYPLYVCVDESGQIAGFLSLSPYRDRPAMSRTAEVSYYVDYACHHRGIGSKLMEAALQDCARLGKHVLVAILLEWNEPSLKLLEKYGFEKWGYLPDVVELSGRLCGHLIYGRKLTQ